MVFGRQRAVCRRAGCVFESGEAAGDKYFEKFHFFKKKHPIFQILYPTFSKFKGFFVCGVKVLFFQFGWGRDEFLGEVQAQSSRREASTQSMLDFLDTFSNTNLATGTLIYSKIALEQLYRNEKQSVMWNYRQSRFWARRS